VSVDPNALATLCAALVEIPVRVAALERQVASASVEVARILEALPPSLVSVSEAAAAFKVSVPTMRRWVKAGAVPTVKVGATVRVDLSRLHGTDDLAIARATRTRGASRG
jgi:excisionase family DNA binding protein